MSELVSNINRRIDSIAATEKLRMLTTEEINCQFLLKQLADRIAEMEKERDDAIEASREMYNTGEDALVKLEKERDELIKFVVLIRQASREEPIAVEAERLLAKHKP
jgi:hypothetical protein